VKLKAALLSLPLVLLASGADGQELPGGILEKEMGPRGAPKAFQTLQKYAVCVLEKAPVQTADYLAKDVPAISDQAGKDALKLTNDKSTDHCLADAPFLKLDSNFLRGALIQAAYLNLGTGGVAIHIGAPDPAPQGQPVGFAKCVVMRRPSDSKALASTKIASREENVALKHLQPDLNACAVQNGVRTIYPQLFRYQVVEELYRQATKQPLNTASATLAVKAR